MACIAAKLICAQLHRPSSPKGEELALQQEGRDKSPKNCDTRWGMFTVIQWDKQRAVSHHMEKGEEHSDGGR